MANILQIPVPSSGAAIVWPARSDPTVNTLLLINQDLNNTVYIGQQSSITANGPNTIPVPPNGSISVDPASPWYVIGAAAGTNPLVMVPNGQANFLGLTQGLGKLAIPSIQSPNFIHLVAGWQIAKDGSAEFNNLTLRGTFLGTDFIINADGIFFYSGTPAAGNLLISIANFSGVDQFGNPYSSGIWHHNGTSSVGLVTIGTNPLLDFSPGGRTHNTLDPEIFAAVSNPGTVTEVSNLVLTSGKENGNADTGLQMFSASADGTLLPIFTVEFGGNAELCVVPGFGIRAFDPNNGAVIESWHNMALANGWTVGSGGFAQYRKVEDHSVKIRLNNVTPGTINDGTIIWVPVSGYAPTIQQKLSLIVQYTAAPAYGSMPFLYTNLSSGLEVFNLRGTVASIHATTKYALD